MTEPRENAEHHILPLSVYFRVFGALLFLTFVTVGVSYVDFGTTSLYIALVVAFVKAGLVLAYFMHLKYDNRFHQLIFFCSVIFVVIMFLFTFIDLKSRSRIIGDQGNFTLANERAAVRTWAETKRNMSDAGVAPSDATLPDTGDSPKPPSKAPSTEN